MLAVRSSARSSPCHLDHLPTRLPRAIITTLADSKLESWLATTGYCAADDGIDECGELAFQCVDIWYLYQECIWWGTGLLTAAQLSPQSGPYEPHYYNQDRPVTFTSVESACIQTMQIVGRWGSSK